MKSRYKNINAQKTYENAIKWTYPITFEKHKIGGMLKHAWEQGYNNMPHRYTRGSTAFILYYAGKEAKKIFDKNHLNGKKTHQKTES